MRTTLYRTPVILLVAVITACTSTGTEEHGAPAVAPTQNHTLELPRSAGGGDDKEVSVLLDERHLKLVTIALRKGTSLPPHSAPVPVTIQVLEGEGVIHVGGKPVPVVPGSLVSLVAGEEHDVVTNDGGDMLLLVHYVRGAR